ncbi:kinase-like protein [Neolentinus lepideus HHB14362 ss-1]|uniref:Kinase-like protein n=1 Tax=Neolentinus lepideus HHB14362 ss-1 TaxID=1314782 RepID=A0A165VZE8_9AGAM|nr:kinase-like protein [Neolentinus lepideus HHB14362 ss-1]
MDPGSTRATAVAGYNSDLVSRRKRSVTAPSTLANSHLVFLSLLSKSFNKLRTFKDMLATPTVELSFDDDDWVATPPTKLYRAASVGNSWGVTIMGRGFDWKKGGVEKENDPLCDGEPMYLHEPLSHPSDSDRPDWSKPPPPTKVTTPESGRPISSLVRSRPSSPRPRPIATNSFTSEPSAISPSQSPLSSSPIRSLPLSGNGSFRSPLSRSPTNSPRSRRRSSQQRVSLIAGRVSILPVEAPSIPQLEAELAGRLAPAQLTRSGSSRSLLSLASSAGPPTPVNERETLLGGGKSITEFVIEGDLGRGAYGLVKRAREMKDEGSLGPPLVIKQVFKSRILADCWKKHPQFGTIPIEIYVMNAISSTSYVLPPRRPWDPARQQDARNATPHQPDATPSQHAEVELAPLSDWVEGKVVKGHPNIGPLLDFFEDDNYYYLVMPSLIPTPQPGEHSPPSDLFDLVEVYPHGLPPSSVRTYLGQIADALAFLHSKGIVHRDVKDENVVLGSDGRCILIDFGSSGLVKRGGWDTFSGTLDYAGPEILRGERYQGKEQDVWAFGVVAYVLLVGECPFTTAAEAQEGLESPFASATIALDERCGEGKELEGKEADGGGALGDAAALVKACLRLEVSARPTFDRILQSRFLNGNCGWGMDDI